MKRAYIEIINQCNWSCPFCPQQPKELSRRNTRMSLSTIEELLPLLKPYFNEVALHVLGEPLLHPNFKEILKLLEQYEMPLFLVTNGSLLSLYEEELIHHSTLKQINFSLHALKYQDDENHQQYLNTLLAFIERMISKRPEIYLNLRLWLDEDKEANLSLINFLSKHFDVSINTNVELMKNKSKKIKERVYLHFDSKFDWPSEESEKVSETPFCHAITDQIAILANGEVTFCCLDYNGINGLGLFQKVLPKLPEFQKQKSSLLSASKLCRSCQFAKIRCKKKA